MSKNDTLKIKGIKTLNGYYITELDVKETYCGSSLKNYIINGEIPKPTFSKQWFKVHSEPQKIEVIKSQPNINHRFELIDKDLESEKFPLILERDKVATYEDYEWVWKKEYVHLYSLYKLMSDPQPDVKVEIKFDYTTILELNEIQELNGFSYPVQKTQWEHEGLTDLTENSVNYQLIDKILFPNVVLPSRPCTLSSEQMFKIVRQHIKQNIDYRVAMITSDYNFCFAVSKRIELHDPIKQEIEILKSNGRSYKTPQYKTNYKSKREVPVFEMTFSPENYKEYTPIPSMTGENIEDLKNKIDIYLNDLMNMINKPLVDCPHCKGMGVVESEIL